MKIKYLHKDRLYYEAIKKMYPADILLDIGCGIRPQNHCIAKKHVCCEPYQEYIDVMISQNRGPKNFLFIKSDWEGVLGLFPKKSVDTIVLADVIEHLDKEKGRNLLANSISLIKKQIIIFTPLGFMPQEHPDGKDAWGMSGGKWQEHKSGWVPEDFEGEEWSFFVSKEFHFYYHDGKKCEKPYGAFWAIYTKKNIKNNPNFKKFLKVFINHKYSHIFKKLLKLTIYLFNKIKITFH